MSGEREGERSIYCSYTNATSFHYKMIIRLRWWWLYPRLPCLRVSLYKYVCYVRRDYRRFKYALDKRQLVLRLPKFTSINCCYVTINCYCLRYTDSSDRYFIGVKKSHKTLKRQQNSLILSVVHVSLIVCYWHIWDLFRTIPESFNQ